MDLQPIFISGPSGVGKSYLTKFLIDNYNVKKIVTLTTRKPRVNEEPGTSYKYISRQKFNFLKASEKLIIDDFIFGNYYGLEKGQIESIIQHGKIPICEVYSPSIRFFIKYYPYAHTIFLKPKSIHFLEKRMIERGDSQSDIQKRISKAIEELNMFSISYSKFFSHVFTVDGENFYEIVNNIISKTELVKKSS